jgi:hypothetical protein
MKQRKEEINISFNPTTGTKSTILQVIEHNKPKLNAAYGEAM